MNHDPSAPHLGRSLVVTVASTVGGLSRKLPLLIACALLLGCKENNVDEAAEAGRYGTTGDSTPGDPPAHRTAKPHNEVKYPPKLPPPTKENNTKVAEFEDLVMNHPEALLEKLESMGSGEARRSYLFGISTTLTMFSDSDPEIASKFFEMMERIDISDHEAESLSPGVDHLSIKLGYDDSVKLYDQLSTSQMKQLLAKGIGVALAERKVVPSEQELNHFDEIARVRLLRAFNSKIRFESADELALFVETYEERGDLYRPLIDGEIGNVQRLDHEELIYSATRLSNPAAAEKVFGYGMSNFIYQDALAASQYLADNKSKLDARLYRSGAKILSNYLKSVRDEEASAIWLKEVESK